MFVSDHINDTYKGPGVQAMMVIKINQINQRSMAALPPSSTVAVLPPLPLQWLFSLPSLYGSCSISTARRAQDQEDSMSSVRSGQNLPESELRNIHEKMAV